ncbi:MAG: glycosyltransferase family 2 protein, partial [Bacteroidota bacterium]
MKETLTVISPVYNEEEAIKEFYDELSGVLSKISHRYECNILFIVDKGTDASWQILKSIAEQDISVQLILLSSRFGHQMSLMAGIDNSNSDIIVMLDSDLQHPPSLIPQMLCEYEKGYDIVYTIRQDSSETSFAKRFVSKLFYSIINRTSNITINESAADFRLVSYRVAEVFRKQIRERNQSLRGLFSWVGFSSIGIRFRVRKRRAGKSKYSFGRMFQFGIDGMLSFSRKPLKAAIYLGLA